MPKGFTPHFNSSQMAVLINASRSQMSQWIKDPDSGIPILKREGRSILMDAVAVIQWDYARRRKLEMVGTRGGGEKADTSKIVNFHQQKTRLTKAQADEKELKLQQARGELVPLEDVSGIVGSACQILSSALSSIPAELQRVAPHLTASDIDVVRRVLARVQNSLARQEISGDDLGLPAGEEYLPGDRA